MDRSDSWGRPNARLDKVFKATFLKMLKELKEDMDKIRKTMYGQNRNINKDTESIKGTKTNPEIEKYNWNEKFTKGIQKHIWAGRRKNQ